MLETVSGLPFLSNEARDHFEKKQLEYLDMFGYGFIYSKDFHKFPWFARFFDYPTWVRTDIKFGSHPIHTVFLAIENYYEKYNDRLRDLNVKLEIKEIDQDEYDKQLDELEYEKLKIDAEINIYAKQKLKAIKTKHHQNQLQN
jgi:hypothetical protein